MSQENVDVIRRLFALYEAGARDQLARLYDDDVEFRDLAHPPDLPEVVRGSDNLAAAVDRWTEQYDGFNGQVYEFIDADPWVICDTRWFGKGKSSGVPAEIRVAEAYEVRDGTIRRVWTGYQDIAAARQAIGDGE